MIKIMYFTASWCGPCKVFGPILESAVKDFENEVVLEKVLADDSDKLVNFWQIRAFPTIVLFDKNNNEIVRHSKLLSKEKIKEVIQNAINQG